MTGFDPTDGIHPPDDALFDYVDGAAGAAVRARVEDHLSRCAACTDLVAAARTVTPPAGVDRSGLLEQMPAALAARIDAAVDAAWPVFAQRAARATTARAGGWLTPRRLAFAVGLGCAVAVGAVTAQVAPHGHAGPSSVPALNQDDQTQAQLKSTGSPASAAGASAAASPTAPAPQAASGLSGGAMAPAAGSAATGAGAGAVETPPALGLASDLDTTPSSCELYLGSQEDALTALAAAGYTGTSYRPAGALGGVGFACGTPPPQPAGATFSVEPATGAGTPSTGPSSAGPTSPTGAAGTGD
jgi:hypothetical protein